MLPHTERVLRVHLQDMCSFMQLQWFTASEGGSISFKRCVGHRGMKKLATTPSRSVNAKKCTNCSGCKECRQPVPLIIPEGTRGSGCTAEVAAKAEALRQLAASKASASRSSAAGTQQQTGSGGAGGGASQATGAPPETVAPSNTALTECSVCRRKPGDPGVPATLKLCGGCKQIRYCSTECQRKDWKLGHKTICERWRNQS
jgi:hypothetical protein